MLSQTYVQLVDMKRWADQGLYDAAAAARDRLAPGDIAILIQVLDHIHAVDCIFQHHLQGRPHGFKAARSETPPTFEALAEAAPRVDDWYAAYVRGLSDADFATPVDFVFTSGKPARLTRGQILQHICLHGTYHRGNAGALLQLRGFAPGRDGVTDFLEAAA